MKYYKFDDEYSEINGGTTYIEVDDGWTIRQITVNGDRTIASNIFYPGIGVLLADCQIDYETIDEVTAISQDEFTSIWNAHLRRYEAHWNKAKERFPIGANVEGYLQIFYPQGVIVNLGNQVLGLADGEQCRATAQPDWMYTGSRVTGRVCGYDEINQWIKLEEPKVFAERITDNIFE